MGRIVVIAGFDPASRDLANSQPADVEVWGINNYSTFLQREPSRVYQIHPKDWKANQGVATGTYGRGAGYVETLQKLDAPLFLAEPDERLPNAKIFPAQELIDYFGRRYFTSSPAWMVAHAIWEHDMAQEALPGVAERDSISEIRMFGITLSTTHEYFGQRACLEWMIGHAEARGIKFEIPSMSTLMKGVLYPYAELGDDMQNLRQMSQERVNTWRQQGMDQRDKALCMMAGRATVDRIISALTDLQESDDPREIDLGAIRAMLQATAQQYLTQSNTSHASFREAQDALLRSGGYDMPPSDMPMLNAKLAEDVGGFPVPYVGDTSSGTAEPTPVTQEVAD